jgi:predicted MFS family arabinose efflux permease
MSILAVGVMLGAVLGLVVGGVVGQAYGWRAAFFATGLPGIILAAVVIIWLREPQRGHAEGRSASGGPAAGLLDVARYVWNNPAARHLVIAATLYNTGTLGFAQWLPTFYMRVFDMPAGQVGPLLGGMMAVISTAGILAGGLLAQHLENMRPAYGVWMIAAAKIVAVPFGIASLLATSAPTALAFYCVPLFLSLSFIAPANSLMQGLAPLRMRAMAAGLMAFSVALVGGVVGPAVVGVVSDALAPRFGDDSLRFGLLACLVFSPWAAVHFVLCGQKLDAGLSAARGPAIPAAQKLQAG